MYFIDNEKTQITSRRGWVVSPTKIPLRLGLFIESEETVHIPGVEVDADARLHLTFGFENFDSSSKARLRIKWSSDPSGRSTDSGKTATMPTIDEVVVDREEGTWAERTIQLENIQRMEGSFFIEFQAMEGSPTLMLYEFVVAKPDELSLARARSYNKVRSDNEIAHYKNLHEMSMARKRRADENEKAEANPSRVKDEKPNLGAFIKSRLEKEVGRRIDFKKRFSKKLAAETHLRVLSLCSGEGKQEYEIMQGAEEHVDITFYDLNEHLLNELTRTFHRFHKKEVMCGDINRVELPEESFDIIVCVSALHHIVELEHVIPAIARALKPTGEFWSIAEYVGRNGTRLYDDAYEIANSFFRALPQQYRMNHIHYAEPKVDEALPNWDCSVSSFEGIRSESVESVIRQHLNVEEMYKENGFIWALTSPSYAPNYDLRRALDEKIIQAAAQLDAHYQNEGILMPNNFYSVCSRKSY